LINTKLKESINSNANNADSIVEKVDMQYYCNKIKPLYIVKL